MKNPAGVECKFFYGDYFRGKNIEECRLVGNAASPNNWSPDICRSCPVPAILLANGCEYLILTGKILQRFLRKRHMLVSAFCTKSKTAVNEPKVGCGQCHPNLFSFTSE
jgi:hypothetical protein